MEIRNNFFGAREFVDNIVERNLGTDGLGYQKEVIARVARIIKGYDFNRFGLLPKKIIKKFIFENHDVVENIVEIKTIIKSENKGYDCKSNSAECLKKVYDEMIKNGAPFNRLDLAIRGDDIIKNNPNIKMENVDVLIDRMLQKVALDPKKNNKEDLLVMANKMINSNPDIFVE